MNSNFPEALNCVLKSEGGFVNDPRDPGGATNKGVTLATFRAYVKADGTVNDLKAITNDQLQTVYKRQYWDKVAGDQLPSGVDYAIFDFAVNSGVDRAAKYLQSVAGVTQDGAIGPKTIAAVADLDDADAINALCDKRLAFLRNLSMWAAFGKGWASRVASVRAKSLEMAGS